MSKRFTDTDKYKKKFLRGLPGPYKLLWDYMYHDCDHAGIWHVDFEIAQIYIGNDMPVELKTALELFNADEKRIEVLNGGSKWFIRPFIDFQYGVLNESNRVHSSILTILKKNNIKALISPLKGVKDKDKDKDKDKVKDKDSDSRKTSLPKDFCISNRVKKWAEEKGHARLDEHLEYFKSKCKAKGYKYIDWDSAFEGAVRDNWAKLTNEPKPPDPREF